MIHTEELLIERVEKLPAITGYQLHTVDLVRQLILDTTPLTREGLEVVLMREAGMRKFFESENVSHFSGESCGCYITGDVVQVDSRNYSMKFPLSAVTRQTLRACGVIA